MVTDQEIRTGAFHLVGEDVSRKDLAVRRETKCLLPNADVGKFRKLLEGNARRLIHNVPVSTVRSIYFDDVRLNDCQANLDGISPRRKVRLRWYDSLTPGDVLFFEVKWRDNRVTGKHRLELRTQRSVSKLTYRQLIDELIDVLPPQHMAELLRRWEPVVLVDSTVVDQMVVVMETNLDTVSYKEELVVVLLQTMLMVVLVVEPEHTVITLVVVLVVVTQVVELLITEMVTLEVEVDLITQESTK